MAKTVITSTAPNLIGQPSVEFDKNSFEATIWNKGYDVVWERAVMCPCQTVSSSPNTDCQNCLGTGWAFINPIKTKAILTSINKETKFKAWSEELLGTIAVTVRESERIAYMDRITLINNPLVNNSSIFSQILEVRDNGVDQFVFLRYKPTTINDVFVFNSVTTKWVRLATTDYSVSVNNPYVINISYDFTAITDWNGVISIVYEHEQQYHVLDIPHDIRNSYIVNNDGKEEQILLPVNAIARKAFNVLDIPNKDGTGLLDNSY